MGQEEGERRHDSLVDEDLEGRTPLLNETLLVDSVIGAEGQLPLQSLARQRRHHDLDAQTHVPVQHLPGRRTKRAGCPFCGVVGSARVCNNVVGQSADWRNRKC